MAEQFKIRQQVIVRLTDTHETRDTSDDEIVEHRGTVVRVHPGGEWLDVELEEEHAGGIRRLSVPVNVVEKV